MLPRTLEPEVMDTPEEARDYDAMDHSEVNARFAADFIQFHGPCHGGEVLDLGTGTARIPIELCRKDANARVLGIDLSSHMLDIGRANVSAARLVDRIRLEQADAKGVPYRDGAFEAVISNSIVHHIPDPKSTLGEMARVVAPGGSLFVRDLARPDSAGEIARLVELYATNESPAARALFEASLHAALTVDEVRAIVQPLGMPEHAVLMTSDRHWTLAWRRPS